MIAHLDREKLTDTGRQYIGESAQLQLRFDLRITGVLDGIELIPTQIDGVDRGWEEGDVFQEVTLYEDPEATPAGAETVTLYSPVFSLCCPRDTPGFTYQDRRYDSIRELLREQGPFTSTTHYTGVRYEGGNLLLLSKEPVRQYSQDERAGEVIWYVITPETGFVDTVATLQLGDSATFTVQPAAGLGAGEYDTSLSLTGNAVGNTGFSTESVRLSFEVVDPVLSLRAEPDVLEFGAVFSGDEPPQARTVTIWNDSNQAVTVTLPTNSSYYTIIPGDDFTGNSVTLEAQGTPGHAATFTVQPNANLPAGSYEETLTISGVGESGPVTEQVQLTFLVQDRVYQVSASPDTLTFGTVNPGYTQPAAQTVTITNRGNQELTVTLPTSSSGNYTIAAGTEFNGGTTVTLQPDETATFTVQPNEGLAAGTYSETLTVTGANGGQSATADVSLTFTVEQLYIPPVDPGVTYYIDASAGNGGSISPSGRVPVAAGERQTFTISASEGYEIVNVLVDGESVGQVSSYTFTNVRSNHTITVIFRDADGVADPDDTGVSDWLDTDNHNAYLQGYGNNLFAPDADMTRGEVAQLFYNLLREKDVAITVSFDDVPASRWYTDAVNTLASLGIIVGAGDGNFYPNSPITRAEVTTIANRMLGRSADEAYVDSHLSQLKQFADVTGGWAFYQIMEATNSHTYTITDGQETWTGLS